MRADGGTRTDGEVERAITRWRAAGVIDADTAEAIRAYEEDRDDADAGADDGAAAVPPRPTTEDSGILPRGRAGLVAEGLAYVGATLALGAGATLFGELWDVFGSPVRVALAASATLALGGAAAALTGAESDALRRLRSLLAALAVAGVAATVAVALVEYATLDGEAVAFFAGGAALAAGVPVHRGWPTWPTTIALGAALLMTVIAGEALLDLVEDGITVAVSLTGIGLAWAALGWAGWFRPRTAFEVTGLLAGGVGVQMLTIESFPVAGPVIGLVVAGGVLAVGVVEERTPPAVLAGIGITAFAPQLVFALFGETIGGPLALFVGGLALVTVAILVLRQHSTP